MRPYEIALIFDANVEETTVRETTDQIGETVRSHGGTPGRIDRWGRRTFAYELKHRSEGYYVFFEVVAEPAIVAEVDRALALADAVLRHRIIRQPEHVTGRRRTSAPHQAPPVTPAPEVQSGVEAEVPFDVVPAPETAPAG